MSNIVFDKEGDIEQSFVRQALGAFPTGVAIATTYEDGTPIGLTINSLNSLSLNPPLILWSLDIKSPSLSAFCNSTYFGINILAEDQQEISNRFASKVPNKFDAVELEGIKAPMLDGVTAYIGCEIDIYLGKGDHVLFIGEIKKLRLFDRTPLVYYRGYRKLADEG